MNERANERPLKLAEVGRRLGVSVAWLRSEAEKGALPHVKTDTGMLFDLETVEHLLAARARCEGGRFHIMHINDAAAVAGCTLAEMHALADAEAFRCVVVAGLRFVETVELERWMKARGKGSEA